MYKKNTYLEFFDVNDDEDKEKILNEKLVKKIVIDDDESLVVELDYSLENDAKDLLNLLNKYEDFIPSFYNYIAISK